MAMKRVDMVMDDEMIAASDVVASRQALTRSAWVKSLIARELINELGPDWRYRVKQADNGVPEIALPS